MPAVSAAVEILDAGKDLHDFILGQRRKLRRAKDSIQRSVCGLYTDGIIREYVLNIFRFMLFFDYILRIGGAEGKQAEHILQPRSRLQETLHFPIAFCPRLFAKASHQLRFVE